MARHLILYRLQWGIVDEIQKNRFSRVKHVLKTDEIKAILLPIKKLIICLRKKERGTKTNKDMFGYNEDSKEIFFKIVWLCKKQ